jgi:hypothetical protein
MRYTNASNIPPAVAVFLATDNYDYDPHTISATALLKTTTPTDFVQTGASTTSSGRYRCHGKIENW